MKDTTEAPAAEAETAPEATSEPTKEPEEAAEAVQPTETDASIDNKGKIFRIIYLSLFY